MNLAPNVRNWWECSGEELSTMNQKQSNFVAQGDKYDRRCENQALQYTYYPISQEIKKSNEMFAFNRI